MKYEVVKSPVMHGDKDGNTIVYQPGETIDFGDQKPAANLIQHGLLKPAEGEKPDAVTKPADTKPSK